MNIEHLREGIITEVSKLPKQFGGNRVINDTIKCFLYQFCKKKGLIPVPSFSHPRYQGTALDLIALDDSLAVVYAFAIDQTITLQGVKSLKFFETSEKFFVTFSKIKKKVDESTFFLSSGINHLYLYDR